MKFDKFMTVSILMFVAAFAFFGFFSVMSAESYERPEFGYKSFCVDGRKAYYLHDKYESRYQFFLTNEKCDGERKNTRNGN